MELFGIDSVVIKIMITSFYIKTAAVFGNLISSTILKQAPPENYTMQTEAEVVNTCGMNECPWSNITSNSGKETSKKIVLDYSFL